jgi:hypothetical protein
MLRRALLVVVAAFATTVGCIANLDGFSGGSDGQHGGGTSGDDAAVTGPDGGTQPNDGGGGGTDSGTDGGTNSDAGDDASAAAYASEVLADGPLVYLRLDETSGSVASDSSGHNHTGSVFGTPMWGVAGAVAGSTAVHFSGESTGIDLGPGFDFAGTAPYSLEIWIYEDAIDSQFRHLFTKSYEPPGAREAYSVYYYQGDIIFERWVAGTDINAGATRKDLVGRWAHLVATYDGAQTALWIDGLRVNVSNDARAQATKPVDLFVGAHAVGDGTVHGALDEVAVYDKALADARIKAHFAARTVK